MDFHSFFSPTSIEKFFLICGNNQGKAYFARKIKTQHLSDV